MPRYIVERTFPDGLQIPVNEAGAAACSVVIGQNANLGVTWVHTYVSLDKTKMFCIYDAPDPGSIRCAADCNSLPIDSITEVKVLDPYFYR